MIGVGRLALLLARWRLRIAWNTVRARPAGPFTLLLVFGLASAVAYVGLFATALDTIGRGAGARAEATALALMLGAIALASLGAKASGEGLFAGTPENEFILSRPVSLGRLVGARCLASLLTDPFGTLFLLPALMAAAIAWQLPPGSWAIAAGVSLSAEFAIAALAQTIQVAVVRWVPRRRRSWVWIALRLGAALAMASVWISGTWILRAPERLAPHLDEIAAWLDLTPAVLLGAPLRAYRDAGAWAAAAALAPIVLLAVLAGAVAMGVAARAGLAGWEEAGAPWAEASTEARATAPLTLGRREWRQLARDRPRLVALAALPMLFFGVQILGTVGWTWTTATLGRVAMLTFSVTVYMAALGPLGHMQGERRAFWILRAAPVSVGRLMAAKSRAWAVILCAASAAMFFPLAAGIRGASGAQILGVGGLVLAGAAAMTVLAVSMACLTADLSDDQRSALGPGTVYLFLFLGGLFNLVLGGGGPGAGGGDATPARLVALALYLAVLVAFWRSGMAHVEICLDAEAMRERRLRLADAATLLLLFALAPAGLARGLARVGASATAAATGRFVALMVIGLAAALLLWRRRDRFMAVATAGAAVGGGRRGRGQGQGLRRAAFGIGCGALGAVALRAGGSFAAIPAVLRHGWGLTLVAAAALGEELVLRGVVQGALENEWVPVRDGIDVIGAGGVGGGMARRCMIALGVVAIALAVSPTPSVPAAVVAVATAGARAATGSLTAAVLARLVFLAAALVVAG